VRTCVSSRRDALAVRQGETTARRELGGSEAREEPEGGRARSGVCPNEGEDVVSSEEEPLSRGARLESRCGRSTAVGA